MVYITGDIHGDPRRLEQFFLSSSGQGERLWRGGIVYVEDEFPNLLFARDGEVYDINGHCHSRPWYLPLSSLCISSDLTCVGGITSYAQAFSTPFRLRFEIAVKKTTVPCGTRPDVILGY